MPATMTRPKNKTKLIRSVPRTRLNSVESTLNRQLKSIFYRIIDETIDKVRPYVTESIANINVDAIGKKYETDIFAAISQNKRRALAIVGAHISKQFGTPLDKRYFNSVLIPRVMDRTFKIVTTEITKNISKQLKETLVAGLREGASASQIIKRLDMLELNHKTIARTEINTAANEASFDLATKELGELGLMGTAKKGWTTSNDEKVRDAHVDAGNDYGEGNEIDIDEAFVVGGESMLYPADYSASAGNIINCRCSYYIRPSGN